jgi:serine/threonine protein phosphatase 1
MISRLFSTFRQPARGTATAVPSGRRVYAVGDIHGRLDLLERLIEAIEKDDASRPAATTEIIFLGDLIDRGPQSAQVVERLRTFATERPGVRFLLGNHEEVFLKALAGDLEALAFFTRFGGRETLLSYGMTAAAYCAADYETLLELLRDIVPAEHRTFLENFEDMIIVGDYAYVHAGIRPTEPLASQRGSDLRWIRREFLTHRGRLEKMIVHGHSIADDVEILPHRIGLDTGAYASGTLSAMGFEGVDRWMIQAHDA